MAIGALFAGGAAAKAVDRQRIKDLMFPPEPDIRELPGFLDGHYEGPKWVPGDPWTPRMEDAYRRIVDNATLHATKQGFLPKL